MIDPATGWIKLLWYNDKQEDTIENIVEQARLCRYPKPTTIKYDRGNELLSHEFNYDFIKKMGSRPSLQLQKTPKKIQY